MALGLTTGSLVALARQAVTNGSKHRILPSINHQHATLMNPNKGETAVCGSSIFVGWLGRGSLVATNRTSVPLAMVSVSLTWSGWRNIQWLRPFFTNPLHWAMCTNSPSGLKTCSDQYIKVTLSQWNAVCAVRKVEAGLGSWWSEPFLLRRGLGVLWPHLTPTAPETPEPHWKTCWRGYWQALHSMRCLNDYSLWYYCSTPNQTPVTVLRTSIHQWFWLRVLLWKTLLDSSVWTCMNCVGGGFTFVYHWTESYVCMTVF